MKMTNEIKEKIASQIKRYADGFGEPYTDEGVNFIIDNWYENKKSIIEKMEQSENYIGDYKVCIEAEIGEEVDTETISNYYEELYSTIPLSDEEYMIFRELMYTGEYNNKNYVFKPLISKKCVDKILNGSKDYEGVHICEGEKTMSVIVKFAKHFNFVDRFPKYFNKEGNEKSTYYRWEAKVGDAITSKPKKVKIYLSANPIDYCSMSLGVSWNSCYKWGDGEYRAGTLAYMCDPNTIIAYTTNDEEKYGALEKIYRQCWHIDDEGNAIQSRLYPQSNDCSMGLYYEWGKAISNFIKQMYNVEYKFIEYKSYRNKYAGENGVGYVDIWHEANSVGYYISTLYGNFNIAKKQYFLDCDYTSLGEDDTLSINENHRCCECGCTGDDLHYINGYYYCEDCCFYCKDHDEWEVGSHTYVKGYGEVCNDALENNDCFYRCDYCDEWAYDDNAITTGDNIYCCDRCAEEDGYEMIDGEWYWSDNCYTCDHCGNRYHDDNNGLEIVTEDGVTFCCEDCAKDAGYYEYDDGVWLKKEEQEEKKEEENKESTIPYIKDLGEAFREIAEPVGV